MKSPKLSAAEAVREYMLSIFREAIPEIDKEAEVAFVDSNPWYIGGSISERQYIDLQRYAIPGPNGGEYIFTIAYLPEAKRVLALRIPWEEIGTDGDLEYLRSNDFYILYIAPPPSASSPSLYKP